MDELVTEAFVGGYKILVVEGPSDSDFLQQWLNALNIRVGVVPLSDLAWRETASDVPPNDNRSAVIALSTRIPDGHQIRFLADLDTDGAPLAGSSTSLHFTDFPALESYALTETVLLALLVHLRRVPRSGLGDPAAVKEAHAALVGDLLSRLGPYLVVLFTLRRALGTNRSNEVVPVDLRPWRVKSTHDLDGPRLAKTLKIDPSAIVPIDPIPSTCDGLRPFAYGHDIARSIWAIDPELRSKNGILDSGHLERLLLSLVRASDLAGFQLFRDLEIWAAD